MNEQLVRHASTGLASHASAAAALLLLLFLSACATPPLVTYDCQLTGPELATANGAVGGAARCSHALVVAVQTVRSDQDKLGNLTKAGTFAGAMGAGTAAIFKGPLDLIVALGLAGATSYQLGNLYASSTYDPILQAGLDASLCVDAVATKARSSVNTILLQINEVENARRTLEATIGNPSNSISGEVTRKAQAELARASGATASARSAVAATYGLSSSVMSAADSIASSVNEQLRKNAPKLDAFQKAGEAVVSAAKKLGAPAQPQAATASRPSPNPSPSTAGADDQVANEQIQWLHSLSDQLNLSVSRLSEGDASVCQQKAIAAAGQALTVSPATLALKQGEPQTVVARGGQPSYSGRFRGPEPAATEITVTQSGDTFKFERKGASPKDKGYTYEVVDQLGGFAEIEIEKQ